MGWHTSAVFVRGLSLDQILRFVPPDRVLTRQGEVSAIEAWAASPEDRLYVASSGGWSQLWEPERSFAFELDEVIYHQEPEIELLRQTRALCVDFDSAASRYAFKLFDDAEMIRHARYDSGRLSIAEGTPLPIESAYTPPRWGHDEDFLWSVIREVTGLAQDESLRYRAYSV
jgi:hypothetical protein